MFIAIQQEHKRLVFSCEWNLSSDVQLYVYILYCVKMVKLMLIGHDWRNPYKTVNVRFQDTTRSSKIYLHTTLRAIFIHPLKWSSINYTPKARFSLRYNKGHL